MYHAIESYQAAFARLANTPGGLLQMPPNSFVSQANGQAYFHYLADDPDLELYAPYLEYLCKDQSTVLKNLTTNVGTIIQYAGWHIPGDPIPVVSPSLP